MLTINETQIARKWLQATLGSHATLTSKVGPDLLPPGTGEVVVSYSLLPQLNMDVMGVGARRVMVNLLFVIKACSATTSYAALASYANAIEEQLGRVPISVQDGYKVTCLRIGVHQTGYAQDGKEYREVGGYYRVYISE